MPLWLHRWQMSKQMAQSRRLLDALKREQMEHREHCMQLEHELAVCLDANASLVASLVEAGRDLP